MSVQRIQLLKNKKTVHSKQQKREIATLLSNKKEEMARIRVEHIIRDDFNIEALELIEMLCELVYERISLITKDRTCPPEMLSAVCSLMWAAGQIDIEELKDVAKQLKKKYGGKFLDAINADPKQNVNPRLLKKLSVAPPTAQLVTAYLEEIAKEFKIEYTPSDYGTPVSAGDSSGIPTAIDLSKPFGTPIGYSIPMAPGSNLAQAYLLPGSAPVLQPDYSPPLTYSQQTAPYQPAYQSGGGYGSTGGGSADYNASSSSQQKGYGVSSEFNPNPAMSPYGSSNLANSNNYSDKSSAYSDSSSAYYSPSAPPLSNASSSTNQNNNISSSQPFYSASIDHTANSSNSISSNGGDAASSSSLPPPPSVPPQPSLSSSATNESKPNENQDHEGDGNAGDDGDDSGGIDDIQARLDRIRFNN